MKTVSKEHLENDVERRPARARLNAIRLLPAAATLGNLLCGFAAIFCCLLSVRAEYAERNSQCACGEQENMKPLNKHQLCIRLQSFN